MTESVKRHLPVIVVVTLIGIATATFVLSRILDAVPTMTADAFSTAIIVAPCAVMLVGSAVIMLTAHQIGRQLYVVVVGICLALGLVCMVASSMWLANDSIAQALIANSPEGTTVTPITDSPLLVLRDIAAFFVSPTVGSIVGAWLGSRIHPMTAEGAPGKARSMSKATKKKGNK